MDQGEICVCIHCIYVPICIFVGVYRALVIMVLLGEKEKDRWESGILFYFTYFWSWSLKPGGTCGWLEEERAEEDRGRDAPSLSLWEEGKSKQKI